jgi:ribonuclease R
MKEKEIIEERSMMLEELFSSKEYKPMRLKELAVLLQVPKTSKHELKEVLDQLIKQGKLILDDQGRYRIPRDDVKVGMFSGTQRGFGFVGGECRALFHTGKIGETEEFDRPGT